jgi:hypothetical protein
MTSSSTEGIKTLRLAAAVTEPDGNGLGLLPDR